MLTRLLEKMADIQGLEWIRLHYTYPSDFPLEVLEVMKERDNICNYLDIPLQHISDAVLHSMKRGTTKEKTYRLLDQIRREIPGITIRTTLIVGYPHETEVHFAELKQFVSDQQFDRLGVFTYSPEEKTPAFYFHDTLPEEVKVTRMEEIMTMQQDISWQKNQAKAGKAVKVIIDRKEGSYFIGRTEADSPEVDNEVIVSSPVELSTGSFYQVFIEKADPFDLYGKLVK
jgi:ribosomal protein S12 methylthiotransferase